MIFVLYRYAGHEAHAKAFYCEHPESRHRSLKIQFAFQLRIKPGSYTVGQRTVGATRIGRKLDDHFGNDELEWYTKQNLCIVLYGLLLKVTEVNISKKIAPNKRETTDTRRLCRKRAHWKDEEEEEGKSKRRKISGLD